MRVKGRSRVRIRITVKSRIRIRIKVRRIRNTASSGQAGGAAWKKNSLYAQKLLAKHTQVIRGNLRFSDQDMNPQH